MNGSPDSRSFPEARHPVPPLCPAAWVDHITRTEVSGGGGSAPSSWREFAAGEVVGHSPETLANLLADVPGAYRPMDAAMAEATGFATLAYRMSKEANATLCAVSRKVLKLASEGHPGSDYALRQVISAFFTENARRRRRGLVGVRDDRELEREVGRAVFGAIRKIGRGVA